MALKEYWFPWVPGRFKADTMHLSALQDGIYRRLIDHYMETKTALPDNDAALARIAGVPLDMFVENAGVIRGFFKASNDGRLKNKKCDEILKDQAKMSKSYSSRGSLGGKAKARKTAENQGKFDLSSSNSQAIAKQQPKPNLAHNKTRQDITSQDSKKHSPQNQESNNSSISESRGSFSIEKFLRDEDRASFRQSAPGWDIYFLMREFDDRVNSGTFERPKKPVGAFLAWVKSFTKGKPPQ